MSLLEEAKRMAAEFEYSAEDVQKGVKEFIREMGWCSIPQSRVLYPDILSVHVQMRVFRRLVQL